jgi:hypothetical protein
MLLRRWLIVLRFPPARFPPARLLAVLCLVAVGGCRGLATKRKLVSKLEADRHAHEHAEPCLLGHERADRAGALALVLLD